jgi:hypothetical protein
MDPNIDDDGDDEISIANLFTDISSIGTIVSKAHETHASRISSSYSFRISQLRGIERLIQKTRLHYQHVYIKTWVKVQCTLWHLNLILPYHDVNMHYVM